MNRIPWKFLVVVLLLSLSIDVANCQLSTLSWYFRGTAQQNNSVLTFNMLDTLNLQCRATGTDLYYVTFAIHKGTAPTGIDAVSTQVGYPPSSLAITGGGTLVYSDVEGLGTGFENFLITTPGGSMLLQPDARIWFRYIYIGVLQPTDAGTYHCSGIYYHGGTDAGYFMSSGGLSIVVNTKPGQARSSNTHYSSLVTYSTALLGAVRLIF